MNVWEGLALGIVQGLTELLPVSSSAHLVITQAYLPGFQQPGVLFDVTVHLGTLLSVVVFFWRDLLRLARSLLPVRAGNPLPAAEAAASRRTILLLLGATLVTGTMGILGKDAVHRLFASVTIAASMLFVTGLLLFLSDRIPEARRREDAMTVRDGLVIGFVQGVALVPGISRSGSTIAAGLFLGVQREAAARFSFLLSIPAILGAVVLESPYISHLAAGDALPYAAGFAAAAIAGLASLKFLFRVLHRGGLRMFAYYCWCVGSLALAAQALR